MHARIRLAVVLGSVLSTLALLSLSAQTDTAWITISGRVVDPLGRPIAGVEVRRIGGSQAAFSADSGGFSLRLPSEPTVLVQVRRPGYQAQALRFTGTWSGIILLQPGTYQLPDVEVSARTAKPAAYADTYKYDDFFRRRRMGMGLFIDREEIDRRAPLHTTQILEARAGIRVDIRNPGDGAIIAFNRCNEYPPKISVYVDGHKLFARQPSIQGTESPLSFMARQPTDKELAERREVRAELGKILEQVNPSDVEMVEVFRGPGELPGEFNDGNCAAISIWTREGGRHSADRRPR